MLVTDISSWLVWLFLVVLLSVAERQEQREEALQTDKDRKFQLCCIERNQLKADSRKQGAWELFDIWDSRLALEGLKLHCGVSKWNSIIGCPISQLWRVYGNNDASKWHRTYWNFMLLWWYPKSKMVYSLMSWQHYDLDILPSPNVIFFITLSVS